MSDRKERRERRAAARAAAKAPKPSTPSSHWRAEGKPDPHAPHYDGERASLCLGDLTDDELANAAFMNYDVFPPMQDVISGKAKMPIVYMTAVKDRIRWLSRRLVEAEDHINSGPGEEDGPWAPGWAQRCGHDPATAAIEYALKNDEGLAFLRCWLYGEFDAIRAEWEDVPEAVFKGAEVALSKP